MNSIENTNKQMTLYFKMDGKALSNGLELFATVNALKELQYVIDRSYLALSDGKSIRKSDREKYRLVAKNLDEGSLSSIIKIILDSALPLMAHFGAPTIWDLTKQAFELLKFLYSVRKDLSNKNQPVLTINGNGNNFIINNGEMSINVDKQVFALARQVNPSYMAVARLVRQHELDYFQIGTQLEDPEIRIDRSNADIFDTKTTVLRNITTIRCELIGFSKKTLSGSLYAFPDQIIPEGEYRFSAKRQDVDNVMMHLSENEVLVECFQEISYDPFAPQHTKIVRLRVISVQKQSPQEKH
jgi:hypothetical protein